MRKTILLSAILLSSTNLAHAGFLDSMFGKKEEPAAQAAPPVSSDAQKTTGDARESLSATGTQAGPDSAPATTMQSATNLAMGLLPVLTSQLGVTEPQAQGGMGSLLQVAKGALSSGEFNQLSQGIPGMETLLGAAPALRTKTPGNHALTGMLSNAGGMAAGLGVMGKVTQQFEALGLSPDMVVQFAKVAINYFSQPANTPAGVSNTGDLLQKGLSAILSQP